MKNKFGMTMVVCVEDLSFEVRQNQYHRIQKFEKGTTYAWTKVTEYLNRVIAEKAGMYDEKSMKGLCTIPHDLLKKHFVDLDQSIIEINNIFEEIMDDI